jgi:hypothetical protein
VDGSFFFPLVYECGDVAMSCHVVVFWLTLPYSARTHKWSISYKNGIVLITATHAKTNTKNMNMKGKKLRQKNAL